MSFDFVIYFDNLSEVELGAVLWVLDIAADRNYRLSLGMGKPLGMGAVQISSKLSLSIRHHRYTHLFQECGWETGDDFQIDIDRVKKSCLHKFEDYVLNHTDAQQKHLYDLPRIKSLLRMLQWPGVAENSSRYMEIERDRQPCIGVLRNGKANEYKKRPVLPTSSQVIKDDSKRSYPGSTSPSSGGSSNPAAWQRRK